MKYKNTFFILLLNILIFITTISSAQSEIKVWDIFEAGLKSEKKFQNPYVETVKDGEDVYLTALFTGQSGNAKNKSVRVPGFWDGGNIWKIRFAPPAEGMWRYETISNDRGLKGKSGVVNVSGWSMEEKSANPVRHGFVTVNDSGERQGRYFTYSDGTPFLWIADTWWDWTNRRITFESFKKLVDTRAEQGYNIGQLFFAGNGWGRESSLLDPAFQNPDLEQIRKVEKMIAYANSKGITVWIHPWWSREKINERIGAENIRRWWRYVIHRLHAFNVIWVLAGEYNMNNYGGGHTWRAHLPERPTGVGSWPMDTSLKVNTLVYPGAVSVGFMGQYLRKLEWWKLEPHPELVKENPSHYCLADPGREYLFYLRYGGSVRLDLREYPESSQYYFQ